MLHTSLQSSLDLTEKAAAAISIIGGADGPTSIFLAGKLGADRYHGTNRSGGIFLYVTGSDHSATDHETLTTEKERKIKMDQLRPVSKLEKIPLPDRYYNCCLRDSSYNSSTGRYADAW